MRELIKYFDKFTFGALMLLTLSGIGLIYSASNGSGEPHASKQAIWLMFALIAFFIAFKFRTELVFNYSFMIYVILMIILFIQMLTGQIVAGTKSWVKLGLLNIQFSEFVKIPLALYLAKTLTKINAPVIDLRTFARLLTIVGIPFVLIALQPDMGTAAMLMSFMAMSAVLKKIKPIIVIITLAIIAVTALGSYNIFLKDYQQARIKSFMNPEQYKKTSGYQIIQSKIAIGSGGLSGKGYLNGTQSQYEFLPTRHTDFIVSVLGEEFGFLGISFIFACFFIFFYRQFNIKTESDEEYYYIYLFNGIILFQFIINIMMTIGFFPVIGVPLPFISYGGSSLLAFFIGEAFIFRIKINSYLSEV